MKETGSKSVEIPGSMGNHGGKIVCVGRYPKRNEAGDVWFYSKFNTWSSGQVRDGRLCHRSNLFMVSGVRCQGEEVLNTET
jgi:hypothetical protein